jgi:hypothetical protein
MCKAGLIILIAVMMIAPASKAQSAALNYSENGSATTMPSDFPKAGLELWLSADYVDQTNGEITMIRDISGHANNARRNPDSTAPPTDPALYTDAASGHPLLYFSGVLTTFVLLFGL